MRARFASYRRRVARQHRFGWRESICIPWSSVEVGEAPSSRFWDRWVGVEGRPQTTPLMKRWTSWQNHLKILWINVFFQFFFEITMAFLKFLLESLFFLRFQTKILQEEIRFISGKFQRCFFVENLVKIAVAFLKFDQTCRILENSNVSPITIVSLSIMGIAEFDEPLRGIPCGAGEGTIVRLESSSAFKIPRYN